MFLAGEMKGVWGLVQILPCGEKGEAFRCFRVAPSTLVTFNSQVHSNVREAIIEKLEINDEADVIWLMELEVESDCSQLQYLDNKVLAT